MEIQIRVGEESNWIARPPLLGGRVKMVQAFKGKRAGWADVSGRGIRARRTPTFSCSSRPQFNAGSVHSPISDLILLRFLLLISLLQSHLSSNHCGRWSIDPWRVTVIIPTAASLFEAVGRSNFHWLTAQIGSIYVSLIGYGCQELGSSVGIRNLAFTRQTMPNLSPKEYVAVFRITWARTLH